MSIHSLHTSTADGTRALGERLGELLLPGDVVLLQGALGAGKTAMTQGIGKGTGSRDLVNSPTFVLINEYRGRVKIYHVDLYRLEDPAEIVALDLSGYSEDGALVVEWPERGWEILPPLHLHVRLEQPAGTAESERDITLMSVGARADALVEAMRAVCAARTGVTTTHD